MCNRWELTEKYKNGWSNNYRTGARMEVYGEGYCQIEKDSGRIKWATFQLWRIYDALHVTALFFFDQYVLIMDSTFGLMSNIFGCRTIYNMCTQKPPHDYSQELYDNYKQVFVQYISSTVGILSLVGSFFLLLCDFFLYASSITTCMLFVMVDCLKKLKQSPSTSARKIYPWRGFACSCCESVIMIHAYLFAL